ncbi:MAG: 30S ribosome-binding factor RbfA [Phycisphaerales bacterium JB039]
MSVRTDKIAATLQRALQEAIARGVNDPRVRGLITVTAVRVSPDLRDAVVSVSVLPESAQEITLHGLRSAAGRLRHEIAGAIRLRRMPTITFELDDSLKTQARILSAIARARDERQPDAGGTDPASPAGETDQ